MIRGVAFMACATAAAAQALFTTWLGNSQRTGLSCPTGNASSSSTCCNPAVRLNPCSSDASIAWQVNSSDWGAVVASPVIFNDSVYIADMNGLVISLSTSDGTVHWVAHTGGAAIYATPAVTLAGDRLVVASSSGNMSGLSTATGGATWTIRTGVGGVFAALAINPNDIVYAITYTSQLIAVNANTGIISLSVPFSPDLNAYVAPAILGPQVVFTQVIAETVTVTAYTGENLDWQMPIIGSSWGAVIFLNMAFVAAADPNAHTSVVSALSMTDGTVLWYVPLAGVVNGALGVDSTRRVLIAAMESHTTQGVTVQALAMATGNTRWTSRIPHPTQFIGPPSTPVVAFDGSIIVAAASSIIALNGSTGVHRWRYDAPADCGPIAASPAIAPNGSIIITLPCTTPVVIAFASMPLSAVVLPPYPSASPSPTASPSASITPSPSVTSSASPLPPPPVEPAWVCSGANAQRTSLAAGVTNTSNTNQVVAISPFAIGAVNGTGSFVIHSSGLVLMYDAAGGNVFALASDLMTTMWTTPAPCATGIAMPPTLSPNDILYVFFSSDQCTGVALDALTGTLLWTLNANVVDNPTLSVDSGVLLISTVNASTSEWSITALDPAGGFMLWTEVVSASPPSISQCSELPLSVDGTIITMADVAVGITPLLVSNGVAQWTLPTVATACPMAYYLKSFYLDILVYPDTNGMLNAIQLLDGSNVWSITPPSANAYISRPAVSTRGIGCICHSDGAGNSYISAFHMLSGGYTWSVSVACSTSVSPVVGGDGTIYAVMFAADGVPSLTAISKQGLVLWTLLSGMGGTFVDVAGPPVIAPDGALYVPFLTTADYVAVWLFAAQAEPSPSASAIPTQPGPPPPPGDSSSLDFGPLSQTQLIIICCVGGIGVLICVCTCCMRACRVKRGAARPPERSQPLLQPPAPSPSAYAYEPPVVQYPANYAVPYTMPPAYAMQPLPPPQSLAVTLGSVNAGPYAIHERDAVAAASLAAVPRMESESESGRDGGRSEQWIAPSHVQLTRVL